MARAYRRYFVIPVPEYEKRLQPKILDSKKEYNMPAAVENWIFSVYMGWEWQL